MMSNDDTEAATTGYHVFYIWAYGNINRYEFFRDLDPVLDIVKKAQEEDSGYWCLRVIEGTLLSFEPYEKVISWRVAEGSDT